MLTSYNNNLENLSPNEALEILMHGNERFVNGISYNRNLLNRVEETGAQQKPFAAILSCMDSRAPAELLFDQGIGDIFSVRIAGNVISENVIGSLEYAVAVTGSKLIMVMGHTNCGAVKGACDDVKMGNLTALLDKIRPAVESCCVDQKDCDSSNDTFVQDVTKVNVRNSIKGILEQSDIIRGFVKEEKILLVGAVYNVNTGRVEMLQPEYETAMVD